MTDLKKLAPWNWFKKESQPEPEEEKSSSSVSIAQRDVPTRAVSLDPIVRVQHDFDRLFDELMKDFPLLRHQPVLAMPKLDVSESDQEYDIELELPGLDKKDLDVLVEDDTLVVRGKKEQHNEDKKRRFHRIERSYGHFQRLLSLPEDADQANIQARLDKGVLHIRIPRVAQSRRQSRRIPIEG